MNTETELGLQLERRLDHLPSVPATAYLRQGQRVRRRRRAVVALSVASVATALAVGVGAVVDVVGRADAGPSTQPGGASTVERPPAVVQKGDLGPDPDYVAPQPANAVEAVDGLEGVDSYTTDAIPSWAQEYGNHGPVAIAPDGRLWVAPDAVVRRTVVDPLRPGDGQGRPLTSSYAVEAEFDGPEEFQGDTVWVILYTDGTGPAVGEMDEPGRWTDDFELWVDDVTSTLQGRPDFAERLVSFADAETAALTPVGSVELVRQEDDVEIGVGKASTLISSVAEVRWAGKTWFVVAERPHHGDPWYDAYDPDNSAQDLPGFVDWLRNGQQ